MLNVWLPGDKFYDFNTGVTTVLESLAVETGGKLLCQSFSIPDAQTGFGITFDMVSPAFDITKPPKVCYSSTSAMVFLIKDSEGWLWVAPCPVQTKVAERGWAWSRFSLHSVQENVGTPPEKPSTGPVQAFQFGGAEGSHGSSGDTAQTISLAYIAGRTPAKATAGDIRKVVVTNRNSDGHTWKVGTVELVKGTRAPVKFIGSLPFGLQMNGPRNRLSVLPYRGPIVAGYQSGTPWVHGADNVNLGGMLDFMLEAQEQFRYRSPQAILGPWMHIYLQALWDCEQNGVIDTWVWDGPDGNPAWDGWQYRAFDAMGRTWADAVKKPAISRDNMDKLALVNTRFFDWLYQWLVDNPDALGVPNDWRPAGWSQGTPLAPGSHLEPKYTGPSGHDAALALKGAIFCAVAGYNPEKARYVIHRLILALIPIQVQDPTGLDEMRGAFTLNPVGYEVYGFEQGEILEALALAKQHSEFLTPLS